MNSGIRGRRGGVALGFALLALATALLLTVFLCTTADHPCAGDGCPVCQALQRLAFLVSLMAATAAGLTRASGFLPPALRPTRTQAHPAVTDTPVSLRTRIND